MISEFIIQVEFVGEEGADVGGPTREFFRLIRNDMKKYVHETGCFKHNSVAYQVYFMSFLCTL